MLFVFTQKTAYEMRISDWSSDVCSSDLHTYGLQTTTSNCSTNYGPYQFPENLIPLLLLNALPGKPLPIYGDGMQIRDRLHVEDHRLCVAVVLEGVEIGECFVIGEWYEPPNLTVVGTHCVAVEHRRNS